jgi:hypothetical protein
MSKDTQPTKMWSGRFREPLDRTIEQQQRATCFRFGAPYIAAAASVNSGVAVSTQSLRPIHGLRHPQTSDTTGWFIWCGEFSSAPDFFGPQHTSHLKESLPEVLPYLGLPPGYRFLLEDGHEDVWYDSSLLTV